MGQSTLIGTGSWGQWNEEQLSVFHRINFNSLWGSPAQIHFKWLEVIVILSNSKQECFWWLPADELFWVQKFQINGVQHIVKIIGIVHQKASCNSLLKTRPFYGMERCWFLNEEDYLRNVKPQPFISHFSLKIDVRSHKIIHD